MCRSRTDRPSPPPLRDRGSARGALAGRQRRPAISAVRLMSASSTGPWRCSPPPSWSRQTMQRYCLVDRPSGLVAGRLPDDLLEGHRPAAGQAAAGVALAQPDLERGLLARRGGDRLEGGVEVADIGRPQDDLGQEAGQRARLEAGRPALAVDRRPGDPAAPAVQVDDDVARAGCWPRSGRRPAPAAGAGRAGRRRAATSRDRCAGRGLGRA